MPVGVCAPLDGVDVLEKGLKSLRRSRMMTLNEFKDMFSAIERHHRDLKLAHLTGKTKDLMDQAERDTKFYHILVKMLCEVKDVKSGKQQESLRKVYTWYLANKHVLYSGPHFGKTFLKQEAQEVLKKATTPRNPPPSRDKHRSLSQQSSARSSRQQQSPATNGHSAEQNSPKQNQTPKQPTPPVQGSPPPKGPVSRDGDFSDTEMDLDFTKAPMNDEDGLDDSIIAQLQSGLDTLGNVDYRCETPTVRITPVREQSSSTPHSHTGLHKRMVHSVASIVNPHASHSLTLSPDENKNGHLAHRPTTAPALREDILQSWKNYNMDVTYGQDVISKLNFVGRSGTTCDVRYTAHQHGEMPELNTRHYLQGIPVKPQGGGQTENRLLNQTLEEFYQTTDTYYPTNLPKYRHKQADTTKPKSAPVQRKSPATAQLGRDFLQYQRQESSDGGGDTNVKLDAVVGMIDAITDNMAAHREVVAPRPQPGFRQPSATGVPSTPVVSRPTTSRSGKQSSRQHSRQQSPTARTNTPVSRVATSPTEELLMHDPVSEDRSASAVPSRSASAIDWRGKITPNTVRYKWGKTKFGGHTYIKNLRPRSQRSAGATSAGSRPKTAPTSSRKKWKTEKPGDSTPRVAQAASHRTVSVDQQDLDSMMVIQHLLGSSESRRDSFGSLFGYDDEFFKNIRNCSPGSMTSPALEYLSFVTSTQGGATQGEAVSAVDNHNKKTEAEGSLTTNTDIDCLGDQLFLPDAGPSTQIHLPHTNVSVSSGADVDQADLDAELRDLCEEECRQGEVTHAEETEEVVEDKTANALAAILALSEAEDKVRLISPVDEVAAVDEDENVQVEVTSVPASGPGPIPPHHRQAPLQTLTKSHTWSYIPGAEDDADDNMKDTKSDLRLKTASARFRVTSEHFTRASFRPGTEPVIPTARMTTKVERSAGRIPGHTSSGYPVRTSRRANELFKRAPPIRTPPSIPTPYNPYGGRSPRGGSVYNKELESHARKAQSPRHYMEHDFQNSRHSKSQPVHDLRQNPVPRSAPPVLMKTVDPELMESLQVCRLPTREKTVVITTDSNLDGPPSILKTAESIDGYMREVSDYEKQVKFGAAAEYTSENQVTESQGEQLQGGKSLSRTDSGLSSKQGSVPSTPLSKQSLARIGRPIAHYQSVPDPDELSKAVQLQKEAAAAVDIQRIFRGYVARGAYKLLLTEERQRLEDEQRAKLDSRRMHREHVARTQAIYSRGRNSDDIAWQRDYKNIKDQKEMERQNKMDNISRENAYNQHVSNSTISVIGPHVDVYQVYHPKKTGPSQREFNQCALRIQKHIRGWLIRRRLEKLKRKAAWSGCSFDHMVKDYKTMLARVQRQHGRDRPKTPFTFTEMNEYMDLRRRYESVFEKKAFGGELELDELDQFFKECDLYPSQAELEEAIDVMFRGRGLKGRGLKKREVLDIVFYVYVPKAAGLENTRTSTWMNPIIDGVEARRLIGSEDVEPAPLDVCAKLVINSKRERRERENRALQGERDDSSDESEEGEHVRLMKAKLKTVTIVDKDGKQS